MTRHTVRENVDGRTLDPQDPSDLMELAVDGTLFVNGSCRALNAAADTTATILLNDGTTSITGFQLHKGYNPISCKKLTTISASVWALY